MPSLRCGRVTRTCLRPVPRVDSNDLSARKKRTYLQSRSTSFYLACAPWTPVSMQPLPCCAGVRWTRWLTLKFRYYKLLTFTRTTLRPTRCIARRRGAKSFAELPCRFRIRIRAVVSSPYGDSRVPRSGSSSQARPQSLHNSTVGNIPISV